MRATRSFSDDFNKVGSRINCIGFNHTGRDIKRVLQNITGNNQQWKRNTEELIHYSDQSVWYCSSNYKVLE